MRLKSVSKAYVTDCKECARAAAPGRDAISQCAAQCTAIGLSRCCGVQLRLAAARRTPMRGGRRLCGRSGSATAPTRCRSLWQGANSPSLGALRCSRGEPSLGADLAGATPVLGPMAAWTVWQGSATATMAAMGTVGVCWLLLVCLALARADRKPWLPPVYCQQKRPFAPMLRSATTPML